MVSARFDTDPPSATGVPLIEMVLLVSALLGMFESVLVAPESEIPVSVSVQEVTEPEVVKSLLVFPVCAGIIWTVQLVDPGVQSGSRVVPGVYGETGGVAKLTDAPKRVTKRSVRMVRVWKLINTRRDCII